MTFTNETLLRTALQQSAIDMGCAPEDRLTPSPVRDPSVVHPEARRDHELPFD